VRRRVLRHRVHGYFRLSTHRLQGRAHGDARDLDLFQSRVLY
jgi:hypothetical protein